MDTGTIINPAEVLTAADVSAALANSAMLVTFVSWSWTGEASDAEATDTVRAAKNAVGDVGTFRKKLLANNTGAHDKVKAAMSAAYREHVKLTGPWSTGKGGPRILPNADLMKYLQEMSKHKTKVEEAVEAFVRAYPDMREKAIVDLGDMADPRQYPTADEIATRFGISFDVEPMPGGKGFPGLPPNLADALQAQLEAKTAKRMQSVIDDMWAQVHALLVRYANQTKPDGKIFESTVEEIQGLPARVTAFNVTRDAKLDAIASIVGRELSVYDHKAVKTDQVRAWCHARATAILGMLPQ